MHTKAAVGRADLLRLLALWGDGAEDAAAALAGFAYRPPEPAIRQPPKRKQKPDLHEPETIPDLAPVQQALHFTATLSKAAQADVPADFESRLSFAQGPEQAYRPASVSLPPERTPLAPARRLTVFAEKQLRSKQAVNQWDVKQLMQRLVRGQPPTKRKTRQQRLRWAGNAMVLHLAQQTEPLRADLHQLAELVHRRSAGRVPIYLHAEHLGWAVYDPDTDRRAGRALPRVWRDVAEPALKGLAGLAVGWPLQAAWPPGWQPRAVLAAWQPQGFAPPGKTPVAWWDVNQRLQTRQHLPLGCLALAEPPVKDLLALLSLAVTVSPELLRVLRCLLSLPAVAEMQAWSHLNVGGNGCAIALRADQRSMYINHLNTLPLHLRQQAATLIAAHHRHLSLAIALEEAQLAHVHAPGSAVPSPARQLQQWARRLRDEPDSEESQELAAFLSRQGHRTDTATWLQSPELALAWAVVNPDVLENPERLPAHFPLALLDALRSKVSRETSQAAVHGFRLRQQDGHLCFELIDPTRPAAQGPPNVLAQWEPQRVVQWRAGSGQPWRRMALGPDMPKIDLTEHNVIELTDGFFTFCIEAAQRPAWALEWGRDREGLYALCPNPWGATLRVPHSRILGELKMQPLFHVIEFVDQGSSKAVAFELDLDVFGLLASLQIQDHVQTFRYLPPDSFLMGSPPDESERSGNEGPQHRVALTEGTWLADTACTQGLWLAVMGGKNPSKFTSDIDLPVENVSWEDVQEFLAKLQKYLPPGIEAVLPTEACWEYACRAGSTTPFSFGHRINTAQVNYNCHFASSDGPHGEYREKTVPVKALPANAWGLFQMHGNVWEWCADAMRKYTHDAVRDPHGATGKGTASFAVRGGSWFDLPRRARSARRYHRLRDWRYELLGFRFALRSKNQPGASYPMSDVQSSPSAGTARY